MIAIKSALIYSDGNCLGQLNQMARRARISSNAPRHPAELSSGHRQFRISLDEVDAITPAELGRQRRVRRNQNTNKGDRSQDLEPHVALLCRSAQTSAQRFEFCPNEARGNEDHLFLEKIVRSLCIARITAATKGGPVERANPWNESN
jgi:hypothetical protein